MRSDRCESGAAALASVESRLAVVPSAQSAVRPSHRRPDHLISSSKGRARREYADSCAKASTGARQIGREVRQSRSERRRTCARSGIGASAVEAAPPPADRDHRHCPRRHGSLGTSEGVRRHQLRCDGGGPARDFAGGAPRVTRSNISELYRSGRV
jgi:hypothetical protein